MTTVGTRSYAILPTLRLAISGDADVTRHFDAEYGRKAFATDLPSVEVAVDFVAQPPPGAHTRGHKTVSWSVALGDPSMRPLLAAIAVRGVPRSFGLSLVQGYVVEALLGLAAPAAGHVLLPAAALVTEAGPVLVLGPSGAGKSSVSARAMATGHVVLGDDQVLLDRSGRASPFPRRPRLYPDIRRTAPAAHRRLPSATRHRLALRAALARLTAGFVRPSLPVDPAELGDGRAARSVFVARVVVVEPHAAIAEPCLEPADLDSVVGEAARVLEQQRAAFRRLASAGWDDAIATAAEQEVGILRAALRGIDLERLRIPRAWPAERAIDVLAREVGIGGR